MKLFSLILAPLTVLLFSCASTDEGLAGDWVETEVRAPSVTVLWKVTEYSLRSEEFPVQTRFDGTTTLATTGWNVSLAPFKGQGYRERARVRYEPLGNGEYLVGTRVERQTNEALAKPLDITYAKWKGDADNEARARVLLQRIRARLGADKEFEVGKKPKTFN